MLQILLHILNHHELPITVRAVEYLQVSISHGVPYSRNRLWSFINAGTTPAQSDNPTTIVTSTADHSDSPSSSVDEFLSVIALRTAIHPSLTSKEDGPKQGGKTQE